MASILLNFKLLILHFYIKLLILKFPFFLFFLFYMKLGSKVGGFSTEISAGWEHMPSVPILSGSTWIVRATTSRSHVRSKHKVSHMGWTRGHDALHCSRSCLHHLLGRYGQYLTGSY